MIRQVFLILLSLIFAYGKDVTYYIAAVEENWNYNPVGVDTIDSSIVPNDIGKSVVQSTTYKKAVYREYKDGTFTDSVDRDEYLGILGPPIRANVGDRIIVYFHNKASRSYSIHPHGLFYDKANEGSTYPDGTSSAAAGGGSSVSPGSYHNYTWSVSERSGPGVDDPQCITSLYYSDVDMERDMNTGLIGMMIICERETPDNFTSGPPKEFLLFFGNIDETLSWYADKNMTDEPGSIKGIINGYTYGQMPHIEICQGHDIILHMTSLGGHRDVRNIKLYGHQLVYKGKRHDAVQLYPGAALTAEFTAAEIGQWLLTSQIHRDIRDGMQGIVSVKDCGLPRPYITISGTIRKYYIAAEKIQWKNGSSGLPESRISFVGYTDDTFQERLSLSSDDYYLGILGPLITVEEGDFVKVVFANMADRPLSLHPHGLRVGKPQEGVFYNDSSYGKSAVDPDNIKTYFWTVPAYVSPTDADSSCIPRYYTSGLGNSEDTDLLGPMLICKAGTLDSDGSIISREKDVFLVLKTTEVKGGLQHEINGYSSTLSIPEFCLGDIPNLHMMGYGAGDPQSVIVFGNQLLQDGMSVRVAELVTDSFQSVQLKISRSGTWELRSTVYSELQASYDALDCGKTLIKDLYEVNPATYYIGITEQSWDYNPKGNAAEWKSVQNSKVKMGSTYKKALFRKFYTTGFNYQVFNQKTLLGPYIQVNVGDILTINFKNKASQAYSIHADGIISEEISVSKENVHTIQWKVPESAGPSGADPMCIVTPYYSNTNEKDLSSGLMGPLVICRRGTERDIMTKYKHEFIFLGVMDETKSWYYKENVGKYVTAPDSIIKLDDPDLVESNKIHMINGFANGNTFKIDTDAGKEFFLHFVNIGKKFHSIHIHGNYIDDPSDPNEQKSIITLFPGERKTIKTMLNNTGEWLYQELSSEHHITKFYGIIAVKGDTDSTAN